MLLHKGDTLAATQQANLYKLFDKHRCLKVGWDALQQLHGLYLAEDHSGVLEALDRFRDLYAPTNYPSSITSSTRSFHGPTRYWAWHHTGRVSNGRIESTNTQLSTTDR